MKHVGIALSHTDLWTQNNNNSKVLEHMSVWVGVCLWRGREGGRERERERQREIIDEDMGYWGGGSWDVLCVVGGGGRLCLTINTYRFCPWQPDLFLVGWSALLSACLKYQHSSHESCLIQQLNVKTNSFRKLRMKEPGGRSEHMGKITKRK